MHPRDDISYSALPKADATSASTPIHGSATPQQNPVQWRISIGTPLSMLALFISGVLVSIGHHLFYSRLHGARVQSLGDGSIYITQIWILRYGTAFAFLAKALLASAVVIAYKQHMWRHLRKRANTITTIDALFAATDDVLALLNPSLFLKARIPAVMALVIW
jgi:hypothetical protein